MDDPDLWHRCTLFTLIGILVTMNFFKNFYYGIHESCDIIWERRKKIELQIYLLVSHEISPFARELIWQWFRTITDGDTE